MLYLETPKLLQLDGIWLLFRSLMHFRASTVSGWRAVGTVLGPPGSRWSIVHMSESLWIQYDQYLDTVSISQFCNFSQFSLPHDGRPRPVTPPWAPAALSSAFPYAKQYHSIPWLLHIPQKWQQWQSKVCVHLKLDQSHHSLEAFVCQPGPWSDENHPVMASPHDKPLLECFVLPWNINSARFTGFLTKSPSLVGHKFTEVSNGLRMTSDDQHVLLILWDNSNFASSSCEAISQLCTMFHCS